MEICWVSGSWCAESGLIAGAERLKKPPPPHRGKKMTGGRYFSLGVEIVFGK